MTLTAIKGGNKPKKYRAKSKRETEQILCPKCEGSQFIETVNCPERRNMKWLKRSGYRSLICLDCKIEVARDD